MFAGEASTRFSLMIPEEHYQDTGIQTTCEPKYLGDIANAVQTWHVILCPSDRARYRRRTSRMGPQVKTNQTLWFIHSFSLSG